MIAFRSDKPLFRAVRPKVRKLTRGDLEGLKPGSLGDMLLKLLLAAQEKERGK